MENSTIFLNITNTTGIPRCDPPQPKSDLEKWGTVCYYMVIILVALVGNCLVIVIVQRNNRMKNATNYLIVNLSVSEILSTLININVSMAAAAIYPEIFPYVSSLFALVFCKTLNFMDNLTHSLSIMSLTIIALDRFFGVKFPLTRIITRGRAKKLIALIWLLAVISSAPILYSTSYKNVGGKLRCFQDWAPLSKNSFLIYIAMNMVVFYAIPLAVMTVLYSITVHKLWVRRIPGNVTEANQRLEYQTKINVLKMCVTVVVVFALSWFPLYVTRVLILSKTLECLPSPTILTIVVFIAHSYYAINPCIYFAFSKDYRSGFQQIVKPLRDACKCFSNGTLAHATSTHAITSDVALTTGQTLEELGVNNGVFLISYHDIKQVTEGRT